uniref:SF3 helicase domain-containing protein n=1 Tax=Viltain virus TaxID=1955787 RepID=A0A1S5VG81_9VIRU|nr:putative protein 3 [Viltain virus]
MYQNNDDSTTMDSFTAEQVGRDSVRKWLDFGNVSASAAEARTESVENFAGATSPQPATEGGNEVPGNFEKVFGSLEKELQGWYRDQSEQFRQTYKGDTRKYVADVLLTRNDECNDGALGQLLKYVSERKSGFLGYVDDGDHIHIIHDCSYSQRTCRCRFKEVLQQFGVFKSNERFVRSLADIEAADWRRILVYYFLSKRGIKQLSNQGIPIRLHLDSQSVQDRESVREWSQEFRREQALRTVSVSGTKQSRGKRSAGEADTASEKGLYDEGTGGEAFHGKKSKRVPVWDSIRLQVAVLLQKWHPAPLQAIRSVEEFKQSSLLTNPKNDSYVNKAIQLYSDGFVDLSVRDFYELLQRSEKPIFYKGVVYGSEEESLDILCKLMKHQFDDDEGRIQEFLQTLVDVLDKKIPKKNCIAIKSPPSAGKNFFFDMLCAIFVNYGQLGRANKQNLFAFQEAPNKRLLIWNEPNYESAMTDTIKMMMAGDPYNVRVKHSADQPVAKTPVIVMTNEMVPFLYDLAFKDRVAKYEWSAAGFLKNIHYKPCPIAFFNLLIKYNIKFYTMCFLKSRGY